MTKISRGIREDIAVAKALLGSLPTVWEGKACVLELKEANFNWRQMEWWAFYFELLCRKALMEEFEIPGDQFGRVRTACFDGKRHINWDFKAKAIKSDEHQAILNDQEAMDRSIAKYGAHGLIIALCDVEYNDINRSFQRWHEKLKGGLSSYERERIERSAFSRYRKTRASLLEILFFVITPANLNLLGIHHQGRNANGRPRPPKYIIDLEAADKLLVDRLEFI